MMKRVNYYVSEVQLKRLESLSRQTGLSASEILRKAIDEYWGRNKKRAKFKSSGERSALEEEKRKAMEIPLNELLESYARLSDQIKKGDETR